MQGVIKNYRRGRNTLTTNQFVIIVDKVESRAQAASMVGQTVAWTSTGGKKIFGRISAAHGNKGAFRARFTKGLPGQALGQLVDISAKGAKAHVAKAPKVEHAKAAPAHSKPATKK